MERSKERQSERERWRREGQRLMKPFHHSSEQFRFRGGGVRGDGDRHIDRKTKKNKCGNKSIKLT